MRNRGEHGSVGLDWVLETRPFQRLASRVGDTSLHLTSALFWVRRRLRRQPGTQRQKDEDSIYQHAAPGAGARILFQYVPVPAPENRDRDVPEPVREAGENLVSEPSREAQEGGERRFAKQSRQLQVRGEPGALRALRGRGLLVPSLG